MRSGKLAAALLATSAAFAAIAACASFDAAGDDSPGVDAGPDGSVDGLGATDGGATDGDNDAAPDASTSNCDATFCSGFDETPYDTGWQLSDNLDGGLGGTIESPLSPPRALRAQVDPGVHDGELHLRRFFTGRYKTARFAFSIRVGNRPGGGAGYQVASIGWGGPRPGSSTDRLSEMQILVDAVNLRPKHDEDGTADASEVNDFGGSFGYAPGKWYPVDVALSFAAAKVVKATVTIDGQTLYDKSFTSYGEPIELDVGVGIPGIFTAITATGVTDIDDVRVWLEPE